MRWCVVTCVAAWRRGGAAALVCGVGVRVQVVRGRSVGYARALLRGAWCAGVRRSVCAGVRRSVCAGVRRCAP
eukprot:2530978-Prymnesium_polylepis.1